MDQFLAFGIVGLSTAAVYAVISGGLVVTYTTTGVFNFAHGASGMMAAFMYWQCSVGWGWPVWLSLVVVLGVLTPLFGLLVEMAMRPAQALGEAEKLVMTVALLSGLIAIARWIWDPNDPRTLPAFFADREPFHLFGATITWHQALTMIVAILVALGLRVLLFRTRTGTEMRATVDDRALVGITGADPVRSNRIAWVLGIELAAIGGVLIAPTVALDAMSLSLVIVSAYAAAIFGRLKSLPLTFLGAVVVGCMESYLTGYLPQNDYLPGIRLAAPAILLLLALLLFPHGRLRGRDRQLSPVPLPSRRGTIFLAGVIVWFGLILATVLSESDLITYGQIFAIGVIAISYVPLAGYAGQISLCQITLAGIGAIICARFGADGQWWAILAAMVISGIAGAAIALPALRLSGVYLALGTAAIAVIFDRWIFTLPSFDVWGVRISLFDQGSVELTGPSLFGFAIDTPQRTTVFAAVALALVTVGIAWLRRGRFGRKLIALRDSEAAYATLGGNILVSKLLVFGLSSAIAGLGGALYGMQLQSVTGDQFNFISGLPIFLVAVLAGLGAVGNGLFTGAALAGPLNAIGVLWPALREVSQAIPAIAGIAFGAKAVKEGGIAELRKQWDAAFADPIVMAGLVGWTLVAWVLRLTDVINGYVFFLAMVVAAILVPLWANRRRRAEEAAAAVAPQEIPVEWWGITRPWQPEDDKELDRALTARS
ncbi:branched-chain amino acid ABC transporter permease [Gordonia insulae]|uniref:High-affinity branched-chain amino acid transport system permease protein LivH n=1 Tax=Gordonia insulae TaxID=2420509 RepID=A0A3G8JMG4_9ACTN|nr:ABC transporter permease [Gordonia insulae]AZG45782.1 High-affinity branched-chain amino acid transport system permease protein LivH [Gordonia insulae]